MGLKGKNLRVMLSWALIIAMAPRSKRFALAVLLIDAQRNLGIIDDDVSINVGVLVEVAGSVVDGSEQVESAVGLGERHIHCVKHHRTCI